MTTWFWLAVLGGFAIILGQWVDDLRARNRALVIKRGCDPEVK